MRWRSRASGASTVVGVARELGERLVLLREDREHLVGLAQRRVRALGRSRRASSPRAAKPIAEVVEDQAEALRVGAAVDVLDEVEVDRLAVVLERQQVLAGAGLAVGDLADLRAAARRRQSAAGCSGIRRSARRAATGARIRHEASSRKSWNAGSSISITTTALPGIALPPSSRLTISSSRRDLDLLDRPDLGAGDPDLLAGDEEAAVVEDRPDLVGPTVVAGRPSWRSAGRRPPRACRRSPRAASWQRSDRNVARIAVVRPEVAVVEEGVVLGVRPAGVRLRDAARDSAGSVPNAPGVFWKNENCCDSGIGSRTPVLLDGLRSPFSL